MKHKLYMLCVSDGHVEQMLCAIHNLEFIKEVAAFYKMDGFDIAIDTVEQEEALEQMYPIKNESYDEGKLPIVP